MEEVNKTLCRPADLKQHVDFFSTSRKILAQGRALTLEWKASTDEKSKTEYADCATARFAIDTTSDNSQYELIANLNPLGRRVVGRGTKEEMKSLASEAIRRGGLHGAGDVLFDACPSEKRRAPIEIMKPGRFVIPVPHRDAKFELAWSQMHFCGWWTKCEAQNCCLPKVHRAAVGPGFLAERREVAPNRYRFVFVSPAGLFRVVSVQGNIETALAVARSYASDLDNDVAFPKALKTFHVRLHRETCDLLHTWMPGILGYTSRGNLEIYLLELGWRDYAIVLFDGSARCVARGSWREVRGWEVTQEMGLPSTIPRLGQSAGLFPSSWKLEDVLKDLSIINGLRPPGRRRIVNALKRVPSGPSSITYRKLLWGLLLIFRDGFRGKRGWTGSALSQFLIKWGYLDEVPKTRSLLGALRLCDKHARTLIERPGRGHARMVLFGKLEE